jgi:hypothetical protein
MKAIYLLLYLTLFQGRSVLEIGSEAVWPTLFLLIIILLAIVLRRNIRNKLRSVEKAHQKRKVPKDSYEWLFETGPQKIKSDSARPQDSKRSQDVPVSKRSLHQTERIQMPHPLSSYPIVVTIVVMLPGESTIGSLNISGNILYLRTWTRSR